MLAASLVMSFPPQSTRQTTSFNTIHLYSFFRPLAVIINPFCFEEAKIFADDWALCMNLINSKP